MDAYQATAIAKEPYVFKFSEPIDTHTVSQFKEELARATGVGKDVIVDLSNVNYLSSSGMGALAVYRTELIRNGNKLTVIIGSKRVRKVFELVGLDRAMNMEYVGEAAKPESGNK